MKENKQCEAYTINAWLNTHTGVCVPLCARITEEQCRFNRKNPEGPKHCLACAGLGNAAQETVKRAVKRQRHVFLPEGTVCISDIMLATGHSRTAIRAVVLQEKKGIHVDSAIAERVRNFLALRGMDFNAVINPQKVQLSKGKRNNAGKK